MSKSLEFVPLKQQVNLHQWGGVAGKNDLLHIVLYVILRSGRSVMVVSKMNVRNLFIKDTRALGLLAFFMIAEQVAGEAHNMAVNPRIAVHMRSRTDSEACANANYG